MNFGAPAGYVVAATRCSKLLTHLHSIPSTLRGDFARAMGQVCCRFVCAFGLALLTCSALPITHTLSMLHAPLALVTTFDHTFVCR